MKDTKGNAFSSPRGQRMAKIIVLLVTVSMLIHTPPKGNWGQNIGSFQGVIAYSNGKDTGSAALTEPIGSDGREYQCTEYCRRFYRIHYRMDSSGWEIDAKYWFPLSRIWGLRRIKNNGAGLPQPGDILCFNAGKYGHVAIVTSVETGAVHVIQQNCATDTAFGQDAIVNGIVQGQCQGWLRKG